MTENMANRLKEARIKINANLQQFAQIVNISPNTITKYERGERQPSYEYLQLLAKKFNITLHKFALFYLTGHSN